MSTIFPGRPAVDSGTLAPSSVAFRAVRTLFPSILILIFLRLHAFSAPLEADECNYAYIGSRLLQDQRLYLEVWDHHPPGMYTFVAGLVAVFGDSPGVFRYASLAAHVGTLLAISLLALRHFGWTCAWFASILFALSSSDPGVAGEGCNREAYMNLLVLLAACLLTIPRQPQARGWIVLAGCALGIASLFKTVIAAMWLAMAIGVMLETPSRPGRSLRFRMEPLLLFALGPAVMWIAVMGYFAMTGRWAAFADAVFGYNIDYSGLNQNVFGRFLYAYSNWTNVRTNPALWMAGAIGALVGIMWRSGRFSRILLWGTVGSLLSAALPGKPWSHYFQLLVPWAVILAMTPLTILRSPAHSEGTSQSVRYRFSPWISWVYMFVVALGVLQSQYDWYLSKLPERVSEIRYQGRDVWARDQAALIQRVTNSEDSVFVWGNDPGLYYYSGRASASRFTMINALLGDDSAASHRRTALLADLKQSRPRLVFITQGPVASEVDEYFRAHFTADPGMDRERMIVLVDPQRPIESTDWTWRGR